MKPRTKYGNRILVVDGLKFDSLKEFHRWSELKLLERAGKISNLARQVRVPLIVAGVKVCTIVPDFRYVENGEWVTEDTKGFVTPEWKLKAKLYAAIHGREIVIT